MLKSILIGTLIFGVVLATYFYLEFQAINIHPAPTPGKSQSQHARFADLERWLQHLRDNGQFNGSVAVAHKGNIVLEAQIGSKNTRNDPIDSDTTFNIASVTKHFTATAILLLQSQDKLHLDDPLHRHVPELVQFEAVTIRHLLIGTSGLPDYVVASEAFLEKDEMLTNQKLINWLSTQQPDPNFKVGEDYAYSNTAYVVLSEVIARISGISFKKFMQRNLFTPAGMTNTTIYDPHSNHPAMTNLASSMKKLFFYFGRFIAQKPNRLDGVAGDGNIITSPRDLIKWHKALLENRIVPRAEFANALTIQTFNNGTPIVENWGSGDLYAGLGWNLYKNSPHHDSFGSWNGYQNYFYRNEQRDLTIIVLANSAHFIPLSIMVDKLKEAVFDRLEIKTKKAAP